MEGPFSVNDKVIHPHYGAGYVRETRIKEVNGESIRCLEIDTLFKKTKVFVPLESVALCGLRRPLSPRRMRDLWKVFLSPRGDLPAKHRSRVQHLEERLRDGSPAGSAGVLRDLYGSYRDGTISMTERRIYDKVMNLLASEVAISQNIGLARAKEFIDGKLEMRKGRGAASRS